MPSIIRIFPQSMRLLMTLDCRMNLPDSLTLHSRAAVSRQPWEYRDAASDSASNCSGRAESYQQLFQKGDGCFPSPFAFSKPSNRWAMQALQDWWDNG